MKFVLMFVLFALLCSCVAPSQKESNNPLTEVHVGEVILPNGGKVFCVKALSYNGVAISCDWEHIR